MGFSVSRPAISHKGRKKILIRFRNRKGFTLIELLIIVAIIGILAMLAIPQFAAYRVKTFNASAISDLRNFRNVLESCFMDRKGYPGGL